MTKLVLIFTFMISTHACLAQDKFKNFYLGMSLGLYQNTNLDEFQSNYKRALKTIADNIDSGNRAFFEESTFGQSFDISFGANLAIYSNSYFEGALSYLSAQTDKSQSNITNNIATINEITLQHNFKERLLLLRLRYYRMIWKQVHIGAGVGLGNGYTFLDISTDISFFGGNTTTRSYKGSGLAYELSVHLKYLPKFSSRIALILNLGFRELRIGELQDKSTQNPLRDNLGRAINFNYSTLFSNLELRYLF